MKHCDIDDLALIALGESPLSGDEAAHLAECPECLDEVEHFAAVARAARPAVTLQSPPNRVWDAIQRDLADVPVLTARAKRRWTGLAAAAVAGAVIGGGVVAVATQVPGPGESVVAEAALNPLPDGPDPGTTGVALLTSADGRYTLHVDATDLPTPDGYYEVWLLDPQHTGLVAVGTIEPGQAGAVFTVPEGVDVSTFNNVDISVEPFDGDPAHSSVSVLRGQFAT